MHKVLSRLITVLIISSGIFLADCANAVWPFGSSRRQLSSETTVEKNSGPVTSFSARAGRSIMKTVNPCHGPSCLTVVDMAYCAERTGFVLAEF